jgi:prepilin-type N-terminal cleavage/methylation domain-containing protein
MKQQRRISARGFTLVELIVTVILMAMLVVALGALMRATLDNYARNESLALRTQAGRSVLSRILANARTAESLAVSPDGHTLEIVPGDKTDYMLLRYQQSGEELLYQTTPTGGMAGTYAPMLGDEDDEVKVRSFLVTEEMATPPSGPSYVKAVTIELILEAYGMESTFKGSASPRQNLQY